MADDSTDAWLDRLKQTMAVDVARFAGLPGEAIVEKLMQIPEVEQAFRMRADRRKVPPAVILSDAADYLDDGYHEKLVADLREIVEAGELEQLPSMPQNA
jgi:hypothetical protein